MKFNKEYALTGATLIDGNGRSPVENAVVVVKDGIIKKVRIFFGLVCPL